MSLSPGPGKPPVPAVCLVVLDGWGLAEPGPGNAVELADTPVFDELWAAYPHSTLTTCGPAVGLPEGQMGNSEVGHLNLGAGAGREAGPDADRRGDRRAARSSRTRCCAPPATPGRRLHLLGLVSDGGVHSSLDHLRACIELAAREGVEDLVLHAFTDGRDTLPDSGAGYVARGRGLAARAWRPGGDRHRALLRDGPRQALGADRAGLRRAWRTERPRTARPPARRPCGGLRARRDRRVHQADAGGGGGPDPGRRQRALLQLPPRPRPPADADARRAAGRLPDHAHRSTTRTGTTRSRSRPSARPPPSPPTLAERGVEQLHVAETEKYAHVTYFFNGGEEDPQRGEERCLVDSPRDVPTYDHKPEMSARAAADAFVERWGAGDYGFGIINFANPDMVGHTGRDPGRGQGGRDRGRVPRAGGRGGPREGRRLHRHRRPRQRRPHARARRQPQHRALAQPGAGRRHRRRRAAARRRDPRRRGARPCSPCSARSSPRR